MRDNIREMSLVDLILMSGCLVCVVSCVFASRLQRRVLEGCKVSWSLSQEAGLIVIFSFAGLMFGTFMTGSAWMASAIGAVLSVASVFGSINRLKVRQKEESGDSENVKSCVRKSHLCLCIGMCAGLLMVMTWHWLRLSVISE